MRDSANSLGLMLIILRNSDVGATVSEFEECGMNLRTGQHERNTFKQIFLSTAAAEQPVACGCRSSARSFFVGHKSGSLNQYLNQH